MPPENQNPYSSLISKAEELSADSATPKTVAVLGAGDQLLLGERERLLAVGLEVASDGVGALDRAGRREGPAAPALQQPKAA